MAQPPRSVRWRIDLGQLPRLSSSPSSSTDHDVDETPSEPAKRRFAGADDRLRQWKAKLEDQRRHYTREKNALLRAPEEAEKKDNRIAAVVPSGQYEARDASLPSLSINNPLSLAEENPWHAHFARLGILEQIRIDVQRVFVDENRFERAKARFAAATRSARGSTDGENAGTKSVSFDDQITSVLATWSLQSTHEDVGYRQGMHEIAALCWLIIVEDCTDGQDCGAEAWQSLIHLGCLEEDTYSLFALIMERAKPWYAWRNPSQVREALYAYDSELGKHLDRLGIATQLFAVRWIRLLFTRELDLDVAVELWDGLFHTDPSLQLVNHVCVAMLVRIERPLLAGSNAEALRLILSFPKDAVSSGHSLHMLFDEAKQVRRRHEAVQAGKEPAPPGAWSPSSSSQSKTSQNQPLSSPVTGFQAPVLSDFARSIYAQSVGASFNRALYNVQHTVQQAYQQAQQRQQPVTDGSFPPAIQHLSSQTNATQKGAPFASLKVESAEDRLHHLIHSNRQMGSTLADVVTILEKQNEQLFPSTKRVDDANPEGRDSAGQADFILSLTAIKHIRDVLSGQVPEFEAAALTIADEVQQDDQQPRKVKASSDSVASNPVIRDIAVRNSTKDSRTASSFANRFQLASTNAVEHNSQSTPTPHGRPSLSLGTKPAPDYRIRSGQRPSAPSPSGAVRKGVNDRLREASGSSAPTQEFLPSRDQESRDQESDRAAGELPRRKALPGDGKALDDPLGVGKA